MLVDKGVLYKRRGIGMFVAAGARDLLLAERRAAFADRLRRSARSPRPATSGSAPTTSPRSSATARADADQEGTSR